MNQRCIPADVLMKAAEGKKMKKQQTLDFQKVNKPVEFTMKGVLDAVARHVACDNQVSQVARYLLNILMKTYLGPDAC
jgi:hypothetical protein